MHTVCAAALLQSRGTSLYPAAITADAEVLNLDMASVGGLM